ncbi:MAG: ABC-2 type transport system permease protein [Thermoproteota archaeon]|jgi:ABC-2 type transport system permease protein
MNFYGTTKIIALYTFKEMLKSRVLYGTLILGLLNLVLTFVATEFTYGEAKRIAIDVGLGTLSLSSISISIFMGVSLISNEIHNRTLYMILSRPISRSSFILGKLLGLSLIVLVNVIILSTVSLCLYFYLNGQYLNTIPISILFIFFESLFLLLIVVFFSMQTNKTISLMITGLIFFTGHTIGDLLQTGFIKSNALLSNSLNVLSNIFPSFYKLNLKEFVLIEQHIPKDFIVQGIIYSVLYIGFLLMINFVTFNNKELD